MMKKTKMKRTRKRTVECFLCWSDGTWSTDFVEIPADTPDDRVADVAELAIYRRQWAKDLAFGGLYNSNDDEEEEEDDEEDEEEDEEDEEDTGE